MTSLSIRCDVTSETIQDLRTKCYNSASMSSVREFLHILEFKVSGCDVRRVLDTFYQSPVESQSQLLFCQGSFSQSLAIASLKR